MSEINEKLLIDVGSTYFKVCSAHGVEQHFRDFNKDIFDDLTYKCGDTIHNYKKEDIFICSSANGGLSTLIIGLTNSFSIKYATNIAFNSGINIIDTVLYKDIENSSIPSDLIDVIIVVGGINSVENIFDEKLFEYLKKIKYSNIVYVGSQNSSDYLKKNIENLVVLPNIIDDRLHVNEEDLKEYLTNLYQADIMGKEDIKHLYEITDNQIYSTPYIVNKTLPMVGTKFAVANPYILIDIGGATTDIHYSKDLVDENIVTENEYDRLVFKKLGVFKSRESLIFTAKNNEFVYELLAYLKVTEHIFEEKNEKATRILMQLAIFLVLCKVSHFRKAYINLKLLALNSIVLTGGITKVLKKEEIEAIVSFFYKKILNSKHNPSVVMDLNYDIWTLGMNK
ncbi:glutamate mutase L [Halarcobacter ebronensis]|uniref:Methylaspartate mutase n=1 Tax=Halarcobacter ebronensis TaxID=1462615 RepID=A0A4V1M0A8_9BACT|nr:glutamate mutase L [Halarcobacter ebronensis]QKF81966.1 GlmL/MutL family protein [Halarcobacter ebronensis]RXK04317.1 methylaspartate mutase [Halarcobacter ebronensis]